MSQLNKYPVIDTHIHLFAEPHLKNLAWMTPENDLYRDNRLDEYLQNKSQRLDLKGVVFIETDVKNDSECENATQEYLWIERIIDGNLLEGEGNTYYGHLIKAIIPWAPIPNGVNELSKYVEKLKNRSQGRNAFPLVKGFRYLLQDKPRGTMLKPAFIESLNWLAKNNYIFDLGIDMRSGGLWQMEEFAELIKKTEDVTYIINHLTKPDFHISLDSFETNPQVTKWKSLMAEISKNDKNKFFVKFSGGFSEIPQGLTNLDQIIDRILPWFQTLNDLFGKENIIWGSDWPVCTINGGENAWEDWGYITTDILRKLNIDAKDIYYLNAIRAYNI